MSPVLGFSKFSVTMEPGNKIRALQLFNNAPSLFLSCLMSLSPFDRALFLMLGMVPISF